MKSYVTTLIAAAAIVGMTLAMSGCSSKEDESVGLVNGQLRPCPNTPNCVSSMSRVEETFCMPLRYRGSPEDAMEDVKALAKHYGGELKKEEPGYLRFVFRSRTFNFKDDLEFLLVEEDDRIHVRSAARTGWSDFGKNRKRVKAIREKFKMSQK